MHTDFDEKGKDEMQRFEGGGEENGWVYLAFPPHHASFAGFLSTKG
jgi:hypothetical protein